MFRMQRLLLSVRFRLEIWPLALLTFAFVACGVAGAMAEGRLRVVPVLFIPSDNSEIYEGGKIAAYKGLVRKYLTLAQSYYHTQLVTDTFEVADGDLSSTRQSIRTLITMSTF